MRKSKFAYVIAALLVASGLASATSAQAIPARRTVKVVVFKENSTVLSTTALSTLGKVLIPAENATNVTITGYLQKGSRDSAKMRDKRIATVKNFLRTHGLTTHITIVKSEYARNRPFAGDQRRIAVSYSGTKPSSGSPSATHTYTVSVYQRLHSGGQTHCSDASNSLEITGATLNTATPVTVSKSNDPNSVSPSGGWIAGSDLANANNVCHYFITFTNVPEGLNSFTLNAHALTPWGYLELYSTMPWFPSGDVAVTCRQVPSQTQITATAQNIFQYGGESISGSAGANASLATFVFTMGTSDQTSGPIVFGDDD